MAWTNVFVVVGMSAFGVDIVLPHSLQRSPPRPEPALTALVAYDHCSLIGNAGRNQEVPLIIMLTLTMTLSLTLTLTLKTLW